MNIRWMIRRDMPSVMAIEYDSFDEWLSEEDYTKMLRQRNNIGLVAENDNEEVIGFVIYGLHKNRLEIIRLAVRADSRRQRVASEIMNKLVGKLSVERRNRIQIRVSDRLLGAHLFLKSHGFKAEVDGDEYAFTYRYRPAVDEIVEQVIERMHG